MSKKNSEKESFKCLQGTGAISQNLLKIQRAANQLFRWWLDLVKSAFCYFAGMVCTDLMRNWPGFKGNMLRTIARVLFKGPEDGCQTVVFCAVADKLREQSGKIFENCQLFKIKESVKDKELGAKLWETSLHLCGLDEEAKYEKDATESPGRKKGVSGVQDVSSNEGKKDK